MIRLRENKVMLDNSVTIKISKLIQHYICHATASSACNIVAYQESAQPITFLDFPMKIVKCFRSDLRSLMVISFGKKV